MDNTEARTSRSGAFVFWFSFVAGVILWIGLMRLTEGREPWDGGSAFYPVAMLCVGLLCGMLSPRSIWLSWLGMYAGQFWVYCSKTRDWGH